MESMHCRMDSLNPMESEQLVNEIFLVYSQQLLELASKKLSKQIQSKVSPEDVVQSALKSFFRRLNSAPADNFDPDSIWGLLSVITVRKCRKWEAFFLCGKRDVRREISSLDDSQADHRRRYESQEPSAEEGLVAAELFDQLLSCFTERQKEMILLRIQGLPVDQIAHACQSSLRTVARTISKAKSHLNDLLSSSDRKSIAKP